MERVRHGNALPSFFEKLFYSHIGEEHFLYCYRLFDREPCVSSPMQLTGKSLFIDVEKLLNVFAFNSP